MYSCDFLLPSYLSLESSMANNKKTVFRPENLSRLQFPAKNKNSVNSRATICGLGNISGLPCVK